MLVLPKGKNFISLNICQVKLPLEFFFFFNFQTYISSKLSKFMFSGTPFEEKKKPQQVYLLKPKLLRLQPSIVYLILLT